MYRVNWAIYTTFLIDVISSENNSHQCEIHFSLNIFEMQYIQINLVNHINTQTFFLETKKKIWTEIWAPPIKTISMIIAWKIVSTWLKNENINVGRNRWKTHLFLVFFRIAGRISMDFIELYNNDNNRHLTEPHRSTINISLVRLVIGEIFWVFFSEELSGMQTWQI